MTTTQSAERAILHFEICDLISRYAHALDSGKIAEAVALFVEDGVFDAAIGGISTGAEELTEYYSAQVTDDPAWLPYRGGQHINTNTVVYSRDGDDVVAVTDFIYVVPTDGDPVAKVLGRYEDTIRWVDTEWKFAVRKVTANPCAPS
jgi:hypothetical protein